MFQKPSHKTVFIEDINIPNMSPQRFTFKVPLFTKGIKDLHPTEQHPTLHVTGVEDIFCSDSVQFMLSLILFLPLSSMVQ